jgi:hypothetical protein
VAPDRVISTVDPEARHGHKTESRGFDGYKGHIAIDPDSEIITATEVTAGNVGDADAAESLLADVLGPKAKTTAAGEGDRFDVYGDASYGTAKLVETLESVDAEIHLKVQPPSAPAGMYSQDDFRIDALAGTVTCPAGQLVQLRHRSDGSRVARFSALCNSCPLRAKCTLSKEGRTVRVHPKHDVLERARRRQRDVGWRARYRATRPKVERRLAYLMRPKHGGRRARMRGRLRVAHDFALLAAAANLARVARLTRVRGGR